MRAYFAEFVELLVICRIVFSTVELENATPFPEIYNDIIAEIDQFYSSCLTHFVHLTKEVELSAPTSFPVVLDLWTSDWERVAKLEKYEFYEDVKNLTKRRFRRASTAAKVQQFSCFITILILPGSGNPFTPALTLAGYQTSRLNLLRTLLRQDFALGLELPGDTDKGVRKYMFSSPVFFPESVLLLCLDGHQPANRLLIRSGHMLDQNLFVKSTHLPHIIIIFIPSSSRRNSFDSNKFGQSVSSTSIFCLYCDEQELYLRLNCSNEIISCAERQISQFVEWVPWLSDFGFHETLPHFERGTCPATLSFKQRFCPDEELNLIYLALAGTNRTASNSADKSRIPSVLVAKLGHNEEYEFVARTESVEVAMFTSDGVYEKSSSILMNTMCP